MKNRNIKKHTYKKNDSTNKNYICTINVQELINNRSGKANAVQNPQLRSKIHKSAKDYNRQREKQRLRQYMSMETI